VVGTLIRTATLVVRNARIYTTDSARPWAEALACDGERIIAVGKEKAIDAVTGSQTKVLDASGRLVLPGFIDAHVHLIWGYELGTWIDLTGRPSLDEVQRRVATHAAVHPEEEILLGHGFDYAALRVSGLPDKRHLDYIVNDRPVLLTAWDGHTGWGNSRFVDRALEAMAAAGREIGEMQRNAATREPTGIFHRAFDITGLLPEVQRRRSLAGLQQTVSMASAVGITTAFDVQVNYEDLAAYDTLRKQGRLTVRIRAAIYHPADSPRSRYSDFLVACRRYDDDWFRVAAIKLYIDGVQETTTAALLEPYANDSTTRGETVYPEADFQSIVAELDRIGFQICTHACGDRGVRIALDAYERAAQLNGTSGHRHRIEHCENLAAEDIARIAHVGVIPCMMPRHSSPDLTARWREAVGPERTRRGFPWRELLAAGAELAFASDWPVAEIDSLIGIHEAVNRRTLEGDPSAHRVSLVEAIAGYTRRAAYACHTEANGGSLEAGKYADLIVVSQNLFDLPPERIREARVVKTVVGGQSVYRAADATGP